MAYVRHYEVKAVYKPYMNTVLTASVGLTYNTDSKQDFDIARVRNMAAQEGVGQIKELIAQNKLNVPEPTQVNTTTEIYYLAEYEA